MDPTLQSESSNNLSNNLSAPTTEIPAVDINEVYNKYTITYYPEVILPPLCLLIGIPGNLLCAYIWLQRPLRHSSSVYLAAVGMVEFFFMLLFLVNYLERMFAIKVPLIVGTCQTFYVFYYTLQYIPPMLMLVFTAGITLFCNIYLQVYKYFIFFSCKNGAH